MAGDRSSAPTQTPTVLPQAILENPYVAGKLLQPSSGDTLVLKPDNREELPTPPVELRGGYGRDELSYLESGQHHINVMLALLEAAGARRESFRRVLDFGCAAGRMLRYFPQFEGSELWGTDIQGETIAWCQRHLSPPMMFLTATTFPHLPFEDNYFDVVYAGSVFTHMIDLADAWLLELRRVMRPEAYGFITIQDKHTLDLVMAPDSSTPDWLRQMLVDFDGRTGAFSSDFAYFSVDRGPTWNGMPVPQVYYDRDYIVTSWSRLVEVVSVVAEGHDLQTAVIFRKHAPNAS
jgi:SAM-dependent methyltransferase